MIWVCGVIAAAMSPVACSLFVDTDGLTGGTESSADATSFDSAGDSAITDAISPRDTSTATDASAPSCDAQFCESFDLSASLPGVFTPAHAGTGGSLAIVTRGLSLPNAVEFEQAVNAGQTESAIVHTFPGAPTKFHCELDLQMETDPQVNGELDYIVVHAQGIDHTPTYEVFLAKYGPSWTIAEYAGFDDGGQLNHSAGFTNAPAIGIWTHVVFESDGSTLTAMFDGNTLGILPSLSSIGSQTATSRTLTLGSAYATANTSDIKMLIDNVACSFLP
ncbi:MAG: hypothetical protein ABI183_08350 [Polyangiaceae bacterium]